MASMTAAHSADGRWWFDGQQWVPAVSANGRYWFDGQQWRSNRWPLAIPALITGGTLLLAFPLAIFIVFVELISVPEYPGQPQAPWVPVLGYVAFCLPWVGLLFVVAGFVLASVRRRPRIRTDEMPPSAAPALSADGVRPDTDGTEIPL